MADGAVQCLVSDHFGRAPFMGVIQTFFKPTEVIQRWVPLRNSIRNNYALLLGLLALRSGIGMTVCTLPGGIKSSGRQCAGRLLWNPLDPLVIPPASTGVLDYFTFPRLPVGTISRR